MSTIRSTRSVVPPLLIAALQAFREGKNAEAERICVELLNVEPGELQALALLYDLRKASPRAAEALLRRILALSPNNSAAARELAVRLIRKGDRVEAQRYARAAVRAEPTNPQSHSLMGLAFGDSHAPLGEYHYRRALELSDRRDPIVLANFALNLLNQSKLEEARKLYEESLSLAPDALQTVLRWARLEEADGDFDCAARLLDRAEQIAPGSSNIAIQRAVLYARKKQHVKAIELLDSMASGSLGAVALLEKARLLDQIGRYDEAFSTFVEGKGKFRQNANESSFAEPARRLGDRLKTFFTSKQIAILPRAGIAPAQPQPIFILGFPRSGTTLVEQILSSHPQISAGGELPFILEICNIMPGLLSSPHAYPQALAEVWIADQRDGLNNLRDSYLQRARQFGIARPGARWFTDKAPLNETHLALIGLMFPESPLIHVLRHPLDVLLSCCFHFVFDLETAARDYVLLADLVEHYRAQMPLRYMTIRYEDMVEDLPGGVRRVLAFVGEDFDERCVKFNENPRYPRTPSYAQVKSELYGTSRYRYRNYLKQLETVIPILQPVIERLGYTVDHGPMRSAGGD